MAATDTVLRLLAPGDHVLAGNDVYGGTFRLFERVLRTYGLDFSYVDTTNLDQVKAAFLPNTRMVWLETPSNPLLSVSDISAIVKIAKYNQEPPCVVVDNTFATPFLQRPLELGTGFSRAFHDKNTWEGHSDVVGGAVVGVMMLCERLAFLQNAVGAVPGPMDCFLILEDQDFAIAHGSPFRKRCCCG
jgi:cystathionine gamma-lyase